MNFSAQILKRSIAYLSTLNEGMSNQYTLLILFFHLHVSSHPYLVPFLISITLITILILVISDLNSCIQELTTKRKLIWLLLSLSATTCNGSHVRSLLARLTKCHGSSSHVVPEIACIHYMWSLIIILTSNEITLYACYIAYGHAVTAYWWTRD